MQQIKSYLRLFISLLPFAMFGPLGLQLILHGHYATGYSLACLLVAWTAFVLYCSYIRRIKKEREFSSCIEEYVREHASS